MQYTRASSATPLKLTSESLVGGCTESGEGEGRRRGTNHLYCFKWGQLRRGGCVSMYVMNVTYTLYPHLIAFCPAGDVPIGEAVGSWPSWQLVGTAANRRSRSTLASRASDRWIVSSRVGAGEEEYVPPSILRPIIRGKTRPATVPRSGDGIEGIENFQWGYRRREKTFMGRVSRRTRPVGYPRSGLETETPPQFFSRRGGSCATIDRGRLSVEFRRVAPSESESDLIRLVLDSKLRRTRVSTVGRKCGGYFQTRVGEKGEGERKGGTAISRWVGPEDQRAIIAARSHSCPRRSFSSPSRPTRTVPPDRSFCASALRPLVVIRSYGYHPSFSGLPKHDKESSSPYFLYLLALSPD